MKFEDAADLLADPIIAGWATARGFVGFFSRGLDLMAVYDEGLTWHLVGTANAHLGLPEWAGPRYRARMADGSVLWLDSRTVVEKLWDELTLKDGTKATDLGPVKKAK